MALACGPRPAGREGGALASALLGCRAISARLRARRKLGRGEKKGAGPRTGESWAGAGGKEGVGPGRGEFGLEGKESWAGPPGRGWAELVWGFGLDWFFSFSSSISFPFLFLIQTKLNLFEFKFEFELNHTQSNKIMHQHECANMLALK